jgi:exonuclease-1
MGKETDRYVTYVLNRIESFTSFGVRVLMVFDGGPLPSKEGTEVDRAASRQEARNNAMRLMREGNHDAARQAFAKSVDVSPRMAARVIAAMRVKWGDSRRIVDWIVAPYEADAQLAYLSREGLVDGVVSEDSDNLPFGVARTVFKWDGGRGEQVRLVDVLGMTGTGGGLDMQGFDHEMLLTMCILSGCDYLACVPGVGIRGAHKLVARNKDQKRILRALRFQHDTKVLVQLCLFLFLR